MAKQPRPQHPSSGQRVVGALTLVLVACWIVWVSLVALAECEGSCGFLGWLPLLFSLAVLASAAMTAAYAASRPDRALAWLLRAGRLFLAWGLSMGVAFGFFS